MGSDLIGLGYVGLPLAVEFGKHREVIGFDVNSSRLSELKDGKDITREVEHLTYALTSSVYGANTDMPFSEHKSVNHPLQFYACLLYTSPSPRDQRGSRMPSSA